MAPRSMHAATAATLVSLIAGSLPGTAAPADALTGTIPTAAVGIYGSDQTQPATWPQGALDSLTSYVGTVSHHRAAPQVQPVGWLQLPYSLCDPTHSVLDWERDAYSRSGLSAATYQHWIVLAESSCAHSLAGGNTFGGVPVTVADVRTQGGSVGTGSVIHESLHTYGLAHAGVWPCGPSLNCAPSEYGDPCDVMGDASTVGTGAAQQAWLDWLPATDVLTVTTGGTYSVAPLEADSGSRALRVPIGTDQTGATAYLWIEKRNSTSYDAACLGNLTSGALLHTTQVAPNKTSLVVAHANPLNGFDYSGAALLPGENWTYPATGVNVAVVSASDAGLTVRMQFTGQVAPPTATMAPTVTQTTTPDQFAPHSPGSAVCCVPTLDQAHYYARQAAQMVASRQSWNPENVNYFNALNAHRVANGSAAVQWDVNMQWDAEVFGTFQTLVGCPHNQAPGNDWCFHRNTIPDATTQQLLQMHPWGGENNAWCVFAWDATCNGPGEVADYALDPPHEYNQLAGWTVAGVALTCDPDPSWGCTAPEEFGGGLTGVFVPPGNYGTPVPPTATVATPTTAPTATPPAATWTATAPAATGVPPTVTRTVSAILTTTPPASATTGPTLTPRPTNTPKSLPPPAQTAHARKTPHTAACYDVFDLSGMAAQFGQHAAGLAYDLNQDGAVDVRDLSLLAVSLCR